jgi:hypothetical protein
MRKVCQLDYFGALQKNSCANPPDCKSCCWYQDLNKVDKLYVKRQQEIEQFKNKKIYSEFKNIRRSI